MVLYLFKRRRRRRRRIVLMVIEKKDNNFLQNELLKISTVLKLKL
jgi:hypothetical protein